MTRRTLLAALALAAAVPAAPAGASESLLVVRGAGPGSATLVVPRLLRLDLATLRSSGCGRYAGLSIHDVPRAGRPVTALRIAAVQAAAEPTVGPYPPLVLGASGTTANVVALPPGSYRVDLHAERACAVAVTTRGLRGPWVTYVSPGAHETFAVESFGPATPADAKAVQWPIPAGTTSTVVVAVEARRFAGGTPTPVTVVPDPDACAGAAPYACAPAQDEVWANTRAGSTGEAKLVATRYLPGDLPVDPAWASARLAGTYVAGAAAVLSVQG